MSYFPRAAEQVTRVLSGLKPSPRFWCRMGMHLWTRWEITGKGRLKGTDRRYEELRRECTYCGMSSIIEVREKRPNL